MKVLSSKKFQLGFTLIELLIAVVIIAVLVTVGAVSYSTVSKNSRNADRASELNRLAAALEEYHADHGAYPDTGGLSSYWGEGGQFQGTDHPCTTTNQNAFCCLLGNTPHADFNYANTYQPPPPNPARCEEPFNAYIKPDRKIRQDILYENEGGLPSGYHYGSDGQTYALVTRFYEGTPPPAGAFNTTTAPYYYCEAVDWLGPVYNNAYVVQSKTIKKPSPSNPNPSC